MKKYNEYIIESKFSEYNANMILEKKEFSIYKDIQHNVLKQYGSQLYFIATFNSAIVSLYPIVKQVIYNSNYDIELSPYQIALLTIFVIAEILHVDNDAVNDIKRKLIEDHFLIHVQSVKKALLSVEKIVRVVAKTMGKTISLFIDMLAYVTILVPINDALIEIINKDGIDVDTLSKKVLGLGIGLGILTFKHIIVRIMDKIGLHTPEEKIEEVIKEDNKNVYHAMRTKEKMKVKK